MDMENNFRSVEPVILLGRPFMATTKTIIDVHKGELAMTVLGETVQFSVFNALLLPSAAYIEDYISNLDQYMEEFFEAESVFCLGRSDAKENSMCWDNLLDEKDADNAVNVVRLLEETDSRSCEQEMEWFESLLV